MNRFLDGIAIAWLLIAGLLLVLFAAAVDASGDLFDYAWTTLCLASWAVLFGAAIGRWHPRRSQIWLLAIASPLCLLGPTLALALFWKRARTTLARDLATGWRAIVQTTVCAPGRLMHLWRSLHQALARGAGRLTEPSFPLGAPTIASLIVAVLISVAEFVVVFLAMLLWWVAATAGESAKERTFSAGDWWFVLGPPSVLSALTLTFFVVRWIPARRQARVGA